LGLFMSFEGSCSLDSDVEPVTRRLVSFVRSWFAEINFFFHY
jgi:hypothetical protein